MKWPRRRKMTWREVGELLLIAVCLQAILLALSFLVPASVRIHALAITSWVVLLALIVWGGSRR